MSSPAYDFERHLPPEARPPQPPVQRRPTPVVTYTLIALNVAVFVLMVAAGVSPSEPTNLQLLVWGADYGPLSTHGQGWRIITSCFVHGGIIHIAMNMYCLFQVGPFTESLYGRARYFLVYAIAGLGGGLLSTAIHPYDVSVGASGAIFGVYGGLLAFLRLHRDALNRPAAAAITRSAMIFLGINLVYGFTDRQIDVSAHIGGLVMGFIAGWFLGQGDPQKLRRLSPGWFGGILLWSGLACYLTLRVLAPHIAMDPTP